MRPTRRMRSVQSPIIPVVGELIRENPGTISLGQGVVHYGPPPRAVERLIREHRVAVIPGGTFGIDRGCYLRVAYAALRKPTAAEGIARLTRGLRAILGG